MCGNRSSFRAEINGIQVIQFLCQFIIQFLLTRFGELFRSTDEVTSQSNSELESRVRARVFIVRSEKYRSVRSLQRIDQPFSLPLIARVYFILL